MIKALLDTNILVSACWKPGGLEAATTGLAIQGAFTLCMSPAIAAEYREVLSRKKLSKLQTSALPLLASLERIWISFDPSIQTSAAYDEDDNRFLECAFSSHADFLITGNLRHYPEIFGATHIVNARAFINRCFPTELAHMDRAPSAPPA